MSNESGASSLNSRNEERIVYGIPNMYWCGAAIKCNVSKSERNPYRRFYICSYISNMKLVDDKHIYKWCDEALLNELETIRVSIEKLEKHVIEMENNRLETIQQLQLKLESEIYEKIDGVVRDGERKMKKVIAISFVWIALIMIGAMKVLK